MNQPPSASILRVDRSATGEEIIARLKIDLPPAVIVITGGAGKMSPQNTRRVAQLVRNGVAQAASRAHAAVVDGGTRSGVMQMMGEALAAVGRTAPLIGVAPAGKISLPGGHPPDDDHWRLEPNHSHFVLVEGDKFGDETDIMYRVAQTLAARAPSIAVLVNGGEIAAQEVAWNVHHGREVVTLAGSGRLADELANAVRGGLSPANKLIAEIVRRGRLTIFDIARSAAELEELLLTQLKARSPG